MTAPSEHSNKSLQSLTHIFYSHGRKIACHLFSYIFTFSAFFLLFTGSGSFLTLPSIHFSVSTSSPFLSPIHLSFGIKATILEPDDRVAD